MKITVSVWRDLMEAFDRRMKETCLRRDAYLDLVFKHEAAMLEKEVDEPNSDAQRQFIAKHLELLERKPVSFSLKPETVAAIDRACVAKNVIRDSFINRVIFFMMSSPDVLSRILETDVRRDFQAVLEEESNEFMFPMINGGLKTIGTIVHADPFWAIRKCIEFSFDGCCDSLHEAFIPPDLFPGGDGPNLVGLNCYVDNRRLSGPSVERQKGGLFDELLESVERISRPQTAVPDDTRRGGGSS